MKKDFEENVHDLSKDAPKLIEQDHRQGIEHRVT